MTYRTLATDRELEEKQLPDKHKSRTIMRCWRTKALLKASQLSGDTKSSPVFYKTPDKLPCLSTLSCHPSSARSLLWPWTPSALAASTARNILPSLPAGINSAVRLFLIRLLKCAFCLLLSISAPCFTFLYGVYYHVQTMHFIYLSCLLSPLTKNEAP